MAHVGKECRAGFGHFQCGAAGDLEFFVGLTEPGVDRLELDGARRDDVFQLAEIIGQTVFGVASLLAPLALNSLLVLALTLVVEPLFSVQGMGLLTIRALLANDGPWLIIATSSIVPIFQGRRVTRSILLWTLAGNQTIFSPTMPPVAQAVVPVG